MGLGAQEQRRDVLSFALVTAFAVVMYTVPGEWIPSMGPLRLALTTSGLAAGLMVLRRMGRMEPLFLDGIRGFGLVCFTALAAASISWSVNPVRCSELRMM